MAISPKDKYPSQIDTTDPTGYPYGKAQNILSPGDGSGTPWERQLVNDWFGLQQDALVREQVTPSGTPDKAGACQVLDAINGIAKRDLAVANWTAQQPDGSFVGVNDILQDAVLAPDFLNGRDVLVVVGDDAKAYYSYNFLDWFALTVGFGYSSTIAAIEHLAGPDLIAFVGAAGELQTTPNLAVWTQRTLGGGSGSALQDIVWCPAISLAITVGFNGEIQTSPDGATWTQRTAAGGYAGVFFSVTWSEALGLAVAVGSAGEIQTSPDGITWTSRTAAASFSDTFLDVTYSPGLDLFAAFGGTTLATEIQTSPDGITWTQRLTTGSYACWSGHWSSVLKRFVADASEGGNHLGHLVSPDGVNWELRRRGLGNVYGLCDATNFAVGVGRYGRVWLSDAL